MELTLVTCLYDIRKKEGGEMDTRGLSEYLELGRHVMDIDLPIIVYTDSEEVREVVTEQRKGREDKTMVVWLPIEDTFFYKDMDVLTTRMTEFPIANMNPKKDTPLYVTLNNDKFDFLERSIKENPFSSEYFMWIDFGIRHCAGEGDYNALMRDWVPFLKRHEGLIHHLRIHTVVKSSSATWKDYFGFIYHHIAGSMFGGGTQALLEYIELYKEQWRVILYEEKWWQLDEAVMTILTETHPDRFRFWYGDYDGLLTNFIQTRRSWNLVFQTAQRYLDNRDYHRSENVLATMDWMDQFTPECQVYLAKRICSDFYRWNGVFSLALRWWLLDQHRLDMIPPEWLNAHISNLRYYRGPEIMKFWASWSLRDPSNEASLDAWKRIEGKDLMWIPIGDRCLSALTLDNTKLRSVSLPLDYVDCLPGQMLLMLRNQFEDFYTNEYTNKYGIFFEHFQDKTHDENRETFRRRLCRFYQFLEVPTKKIVFLHTTERFLLQPFSGEEKVAYDEDLVSLCGYIERNFPNLDFTIIHLSTNRPFYGKHARIIPFVIWTPVEYTPRKDISIHHIFLYRSAIYTWFEKLLSLRIVKDDGEGETKNETDYGTEITRDCQ